MTPSNQDGIISRHKKIEITIFVTALAVLTTVWVVNGYDDTWLYVTAVIIVIPVRGTIGEDEFDERATLKRVYTTPKAMILKPENDSFPTQIITGPSEVRGKLISVIRNY